MFVRFALLALVAAVTAVPVTNGPVPEPITTIVNEDIGAPWFSFPSISSLFAPLFKLIPTFAEIGPKIVVDDSKFQIIMNGLKDYKKEDLKVKIKGPFIFIQGSHEVKEDQHDLYTSQFFQTYSLPDKAKNLDVTATLSSDGVLVVTAPLSEVVDRPKEQDREVPVVETGVPYEGEKDQTDKGDGKGGKGTVDQTTVVDQGGDLPDKGDVAPKGDQPEVSNTKDQTTVIPISEDRKEPTTAEYATEKDNVIPHGNEINA